MQDMSSRPVCVAFAQGEDEVRRSGVPYAVVRPCALTEEPAGADLVISQGDTIKVIPLQSSPSRKYRNPMGKTIENNPDKKGTAEHVLEGKAGASAINNLPNSAFMSSCVGGRTSRVATTTSTIPKKTFHLLQVLSAGIPEASVWSP